VNVADLLDGTSSQQQQQQQQQQQLHSDSKQRTGLKKGMKGLAKRFKALLGGKQSSGSNAAQQQQQQQQQQLEPAALHQQLLHRVQPAGSFAGRVGSSASAPAAVRGEDGSMSVDLMAHIDIDYAAEGLLPPAGRQFSAASAYSGRHPSSTGSIGYYQSGQSNTGSYPSWTGIGGQAYGSMTGQCASITLQQQRLALLQQQKMQQQSFAGAGSFGGASAGSSAGAGSYENFGEKLKMLRAMYGSQYSSDTCKPPAAAAAGMNVGAAAAPSAAMYAGPPPAAVGAGPSLSSMEPLPALKEEVDMPAAATAAAAADNSSRQQFMQKLSKAFGLGPKQQQQEDEAGGVLGSGLSLTERSNSSFSLFLARVASGWRQDSSSTAAAAFHEDSYPPLAVGRSSFSHTTSVNPSLPSTGANSSSSAAANAAAVAAAMAAANAAAAAAAGSTPQTVGAAAAATGAAVEGSRGSFSRMFAARPAAPSAAAAGPHPMDACAAAAVEPSSRSFSKLFGSCAGGESHGAGGIEQSRGSFSKLFGPCLDAACGDANAAAVASAAGMHAIEPSRSSFSRLLSAGRADSCGPMGGPAAVAAAAAAAGSTAVPGVEHSKGSFSKLFGTCASVQGGLAGVEHSRGSFSRLLGACGGAGSDPNAAAAVVAGVLPPQGVEHSRGSFSKLPAPFSSCAGLETSNAAAEAGAASAAGVGQDAGIERSSRSFSRLLGPCGGDLNAAALVEGSSRSFNKLFSSCSGCAGDVSVVGGSSSAAGVTTAEDATQADATMTAPDDAAGAAAAAAAGFAQGDVQMGVAGAMLPYEQQPSWMQQAPPPNFSLQQQQGYLQQQHHQQQHDDAALYPALHASLLLPAVPEIAAAEQQTAYTAEPAADMLADASLLQDPADNPSLALLHMDEGMGI
jgi:hypothetical protein